VNNPNVNNPNMNKPNMNNLHSRVYVQILQAANWDILLKVYKKIEDPMRLPPNLAKITKNNIEDPIVEITDRISLDRISPDHISPELNFI